jgi:23S rRNA (cytosine1962-C5)-methyltransferase
VDRIGHAALSQAEASPSGAQLQYLRAMPGVSSIYHKHLNRQVRRATAAEASPERIAGESVPDPFIVRENGVRYELSFREGYSVGLFLDQRDNRRRLLTKHVGAQFPLFEGEASGQAVLNTFSYTCGFSVCAALAGARTTSLDLSKKYLEWGKRNFRLNDLDPDEHEFLYGDALNWLGRLARKERLFDAVLLDPPTFSQSKESGVFRVEKDYGKLVTAALGVLRPAGVLFASTNAAALTPEEFVATVTQAVIEAGRTTLQRLYVPQPPDFPISRTEPGYLKTLWLRVR